MKLLHFLWIHRFLLVRSMDMNSLTTKWWWIMVLHVTYWATNQEWRMFSICVLLDQVMRFVVKTWWRRHSFIIKRYILVCKLDTSTCSVFITRAVVQKKSEVMLWFLWFCFTSLSDWLKKSAALSYPMRRVKTKTNRDLLARVFPHLTCICFDFWLVHFFRFVPVVIGYCNYFGFGFTTLIWKLLS